MPVGRSWHTYVEVLFTLVRGRVFLRTSALRSSANFGLTEFSEPRFESFKQASTKPEGAARIPALVGSKRGVFTVLHTVVYGVLVVGGVCLLALVGFELVHRLVPAQSRQRHNDVAGFIYAALGVIYAVLLALVVITVWEEYQAASETVEEEAN